MEAQGAAWLFFWTSLSLLLISVGAAEVTTSPKIFPMDTPVQLDITNKCKPLQTDSVEWKKDNARLCRKKKMSEVQDLDKINKCKIQSNGTLYLQQLEKEGQKEYFVEVHDSSGKHKCSESVTVIGQYPVDTLFMNFTCKDKKKVEVYCSISQGTDPEMILKQDDTTLKTGNGKSLSYTSAYKAIVNFTCIAKNKVTEKIHTLTLDCEKEGWDWYLYLAAAAGGVAFIIFIILIIYSVKSCRRPDEETPYDNQMRVMQERQLPQPPGQASAPPPCVTTADEMDYINSQKPLPHRQGAPEAPPEGKKGRRTRPRPPEPRQGQPEDLPLNHQCPAPQQTRPALPGNHPSDHQAPRPTPRTKSKPPRQNRKSR